MSFDTLTYSKDLVEAGEKPEVAEVHALALKKMMDDDLVTKSHFDTQLDRGLKELSHELKAEIKEEIGSLRNEIKEEIGSLRNEVKQEISSLRTEIKQEVDPLKTDITTIKAELGMIKWMMGGTVFGIFLLVIKTFLI